MKKAFARFLLSLSVIFLVLVTWGIFVARHALLNPDAKAVSEISGNAIFIFKDRGTICFLIDEQTGKVRAKIVTSPPAVIPFRTLYHSASCKTIGSEVICSTLTVFNVINAPIRVEPWGPMAGASTFTGPVSLREGTFNVYIGETYQGRMIVTVDKNMSNPWCKSPLGTLEFTIPPTPTKVR
jgi:hypothetical protein